MDALFQIEQLVDQDFQCLLRSLAGRAAVTDDAAAILEAVVGCKDAVTEPPFFPDFVEQPRTHAIAQDANGPASAEIIRMGIGHRFECQRDLGLLTFKRDVQRTVFAITGVDVPGSTGLPVSQQIADVILQFWPVQLARYRDDRSIWPESLIKKPLDVRVGYRLDRLYGSVAIPTVWLTVESFTKPHHGPLRQIVVDGPNFRADRGEFVIYRDGEEVRRMYPEKRQYRSGQVMTEAALDPGLTRDLYVSLGEPLDAMGRAWAVRLYHKPFVRFIWLGALLMMAGGFLAASDKRYRRERKAVPA